MTTASPACMGCFVNNPANWWNPPPPDLFKSYPLYGPRVVSTGPGYMEIETPDGVRQKYHLVPDQIKVEWPDTTPRPKPSLTDEEKDVLKHLADAWMAFSKLDRKHPDDDREFQYAIHLAQQKIGMRVARRTDRDVWFQPEENNGD